MHFGAAKEHLLTGSGMLVDHEVGNSNACKLVCHYLDKVEERRAHFSYMELFRQIVDLQDYFQAPNIKLILRSIIAKSQLHNL